MDSEKHLFNQVKAFFSGTILSRLTGLVRDIAMAFSFGSHASVAAFMVALRLSHLFRRLLGEGSMHQAFVPFFEAERHDHPGKAARFYQGIGILLGIISITLVLLGEAVLATLWFTGAVSLENQEVLVLTMVLLPSLIFLTINALQSSFLQCLGGFFLPGFSPALVNLIWIIGALYLHGQVTEEAIFSLTVFVLAGYVAQWLFLVPSSFKQVQILLRQSPHPFSLKEFSSATKRFLAFFGLGAIGVGAAQLNSALDALFARSADLQGPAYLWYAIRIQQLPLALFGVALSGALLPSLSRAIKAEDKEKYTSLLISSLKKATAFILPASSALIFLSYPIISLVYERGDFSVLDTSETTRCLWAYTLGLPPMLWVLILAPAFYARKNFKVPVLLSLVSLGLNALLNTIFIYGLGFSAVSVALATSISAWVNAGYLYYKLKPLLTKNPFEELLKSALKVTLSVLLGGGGAYALGVLYWQDPSVLILLDRGISQNLNFWVKFSHFGAQAFLFLLIYFGFAKLIKDKETFSLWGLLKG